MNHPTSLWSLGSAAAAEAEVVTHTHRAEAWAASVHKHHRIVQRRHSRRLVWVTVAALLALIMEVV